MLLRGDGRPRGGSGVVRIGHVRRVRVEGLGGEILLAGGARGSWCLSLTSGVLISQVSPSLKAEVNYGHLARLGTGTVHRMFSVVLAFLWCHGNRLRSGQYQVQRRVETRSLTSLAVLLVVASVGSDVCGSSSRDCMNESILMLGWDMLLLLGDGDGGATRDLLAPTRSRSLLLLRSFLDCLWRSMTISMLSIGRDMLRPPSGSSVLIGVLGGDGSLIELVLARDRERAEEREELEERVWVRRSERELER